MQNGYAWVLSLVWLFAAFNDSRSQDSTSFQITGYAEFYWGAQQGGADERPGFLYNHTDNGPALNLAWVKYTLSHNRWKLVAAPMAGTYVKRNLASEPNAVKHIYEASLGFQFNKNARIDAGILPSHIGVETSFGPQQINVSRSLLAENTPYYECGLRLSGRMSNLFDWAVLILNGWQRIALDEERNWPAVGAQIQYIERNGSVLNYSNYVGRIGSRFTIYHNLYGQWQIAKYWRVESQLNYEAVPLDKDFVGYSLSIGRCFWKKWAMAGRVEQMRDNRGLFFQTPYSPVNLNPGSWSLNLDYTPHKSFMCRFESRRLWSAKGEQIEALPITSALWLLTASASLSF